MDGEEEAAFVDSFFLPGGILDPEEEEDDAPEEAINEGPSVWGGAPPENPWANETRPSQSQSAWNSDKHSVDGRAIASPTMGSAVPLATDRMVSRPTTKDNDNIGVRGPIGNASYELPNFVPGPLHVSDRLRETLQASLVGASVRPMANQHTSYTSPQSNQAVLHPSPDFSGKNGLGNAAIPPAFRPPPGFTQHQPQTRIREEAHVHAIMDEEENEDSVRSDSSVPHELYDRESLSASSLSGSSSIDVDESTATPNTSSMLDETPNNSALLEDSMEIQMTESRDVAAVERPQHVMAKGDREEVAEKSSRTLPRESPKPAKPILSPQTPSSPVIKSRNRRSGKAKRNKPSSPAKAKSTACNAKKLSPSYTEYLQASWDWTAGLLQHLWTVLLSGLEVAFLVFKIAALFWMALFRICRILLFTLIRIAGVLVSFSICVGQNAYLEATQEWRVVWYFAIMYFTPHCMSMLMNSVILPHWTPHLLACVILMALCRQPYARVVYYSDTDRADANNRQDPANGTTRSNEKKQQMTARDVSKVILRQIRFNLPAVFLLEGFADEIGMAMVLNGPGRIITAYIILILRLGMLFSPMAWLCGATQVLMASYLDCIPLIDLFVVLVGLSSIRYCKFLEQCNQAAQDIRAQEK